MLLRREPMSTLTDVVSGLAAALCAFTLVSAPGCGTDARGIDDCRNIEEARCEAAKNCGLGITDVDACRRFYRDQCLHGLPVDSPGAPAVAACVSLIRSAGTCATSPDTLLSDCSPPISEPKLTKACEIVASPELTTQCAFLVPPPSGTGGSAGSSGTAGSGGDDAGTSGSGGASGTGGAAGAAN